MGTEISLKELLKIGVDQLKDLTNVPTPDFRLEQVEWDKKKEEWEIVISFLVENINKRMNPLGLPVSEFKYHRIYKKLRINNDGEVIAMYIFNGKE
jgi:hypothetical protein